jgi:glutathione peroxidase-family protein
MLSKEPGTDAEIKAFAAARGATFDMFSKIDVNGGNTHPLFAYLKDKQVCQSY